jgi:hypothetical protein
VEGRNTSTRPRRSIPPPNKYSEHSSVLQPNPSLISVHRFHSLFPFPAKHCQAPHPSPRSHKNGMTTPSVLALIKRAISLMVNPPRH